MEQPKPQPQKTTTEILDQVYINFIEEAENFFVKPFLSTDTIKREYTFCLDVLFNISKTQDTARGIMAVNPRYGQGKSFFFDVVNHRAKRRKGKPLFVKTTAKDLCQLYTSAGQGENPQTKLEQFIKCKNLFIDDIGDEGDNKVFSHYANKLNVMRFVLLKRYEWWIEKGWKTYGTTNLTIEEIGDCYDGRVADRLKQMVHWKEFDFLGKGSFRQMEQTRVLTQVEIDKNWEKFKAPEKSEKIDLIKYFNDMINEPDEYFEGLDLSAWSFTKEFLIKKGLLTDEDLQAISESDLVGSEALLKHSTRKTIGSQKKHAKASYRRDTIRRAIGKITKRDIYNTAENIIAKKAFMKLRAEKHVFTNEK